MAKHKRAKKHHKGMASHVAEFKRAKKGHKKHGGKRSKKG